jgi:hypothetical protein
MLGDIWYDDTLIFPHNKLSLYGLHASLQVTGYATVKIAQ